LQAGAGAVYSQGLDPGCEPPVKWSGGSQTRP
jgi:hypothetical protein